MFCLFTWTDEGLYFYSNQLSGKWERNLLFHFIAELETFSELVLRKALFLLYQVLVITDFISKSMAVLLNVMFMCVGIQC